MFEKISKLSVKSISYCQLNCVYCHQLFDDKYRIKKHFTDYLGLEKFLLSIPLDERVDVTITGGEITLSPQDFYNTYKVFKKVEKKIDVKFDICIVTNGTNMKIIYEWCDKGYIEPHKTAISWDGIYSASKSRKTSGKYNDEFFCNMIKELGKTQYNKDISITTAITPMTIDDLYDSYKFCLENNVFNWGYYFIHEGDYSDSSLQNKFKEQIEKIAKLYLEYYNKGEEVSYYNWQLIYSKRKNPDNFYICNKLGNNYHIDMDGDIYPCIYFGDHKAYKIGNLESGIDNYILEKFKNEYSILPKCDFKNCGNCQCSECPASNFVHNKSVSARFCNLCKILPIENEIYEKYAKDLGDELYIPNDIKKCIDNLKNSDIVYTEKTGIESPNFNGVRKW